MSFATCVSPSRLNYHPLCKISVHEFDAESQMVVGTYNFVGPVPVYQPFVSHDGSHIITFGMYGGKTAEILKAGTSGFKSTIEAMLALDFNITNVDNYTTFNDFAHTQHEVLGLFVVSLLSNHTVAIVDMFSSNNQGRVLRHAEREALLGPQEPFFSSHNNI